MAAREDGRWSHPTADTPSLLFPLSVRQPVDVRRSRPSTANLICRGLVPFDTILRRGPTG